MDYLAINQTLFDLNAAWLSNAEAFTAYCQSFGEDLQAASEIVAEQLQSAKTDNRGTDGDTLVSLINKLAQSSRQYHQVLSRWLTEYATGAPGLDADVRKRALFWMRQIAEMLTPSNFFWTNPKAVQRYVKSEGESLMKGLENWLADLEGDDGLPQMADPAAFAVGKNIAVTPGQVVYRNHLVEVIQYAPQTGWTWKVPIVLVQPWINKYYVFDLSPQNSFVQYLVRQGFTVFITSWKNPNSEMRHITFEDYMLQGALQSINVARDICQSDTVHAAGYCIGGTLLAALMGWLNGESGLRPIADITLFATLLDFSEPGDLKSLVNPATLETVKQLVAADGVLERRYLSYAFRLLNSGDLIWRAMINSYFFGAPPPRSDMLFWNEDGTNLPGAMCTFYLKAFYLENRIVRPDALVLAERPIDLKQVRLPIYVVGAQKDHICPWPATFQTCRLTGGPVRYVLTSEGHITGIVNPPSPWNKKVYWAGAATRRRDENKWLRHQEPLPGSWWPDWVTWLQPRSGTQKSPALQARPNPALGPAPGTYVHE